jgi:hypothetical protein
MAAKSRSSLTNHCDEARFYPAIHNNRSQFNGDRNNSIAKQSFEVSFARIVNTSRAAKK